MAQSKTTKDEKPLMQSQTSALHLEPFNSAAASSNASLMSLSSQYSRRNCAPTPRRAITPKQAVDTLQLGLTQANDIQHLLEQEVVEIQKHCASLKSNIGDHFEGLIEQLKDRMESLHQQVDSWQKDKILQVQAENERAFQFEERCTKARAQCTKITQDETLNTSQKKKQVQSIKSQVLSADGGYALNYGDSKHLAQYINAMTTMLAVEYPPQMFTDNVGEYGDVVKDNASSRLSVPVLELGPVVKGRESKSGYKVNLKWTVSQPLSAHNFIIRCLTQSTDNEDAKVNAVDDEKREEQRDPQWKSLLFRIKKGDPQRSEFETEDIDGVFLFDTQYRFRIEYHISDPVNLLIGSNEQDFGIRDEPPQGDQVEMVELEYHSSRGNSYEGHPRGLLVGTREEYRSEKNKEFDYGERDWIIFKLKHTGVARQYLPKLLVLKNGSGPQGVRDMVISIGDLKEWHGYDRVKLKQQSSEYQKCKLHGVDWKLVKQMKSQWVKLEFIENFGEHRGSQCRFKMTELKLYGFEFK